jgi:PEGA domain
VGTKRLVLLIAASVLSLLVGLGTPAFAQARHPGGGAGGPGHGPSPGGPGPGGPHSGGPVYGRPVHGSVVAGGAYYGYPFWYGFGWYGYPSLYGGWGWPYGPYPYYYPSYGYDPGASLRLEVTPKDAEVYINGYLAGTVDDFDGTFQRLRLPPGGHELTLYHDGFKTVHQSLHLSVGSTFKVKYKMEPLAPGDVTEGRPTPPPPQSDEGQAGPAGPSDGRPSPPAPPRRPPPSPPRSTAPSGYSTLAIRVQPVDAIVLIDGERWETSPGQDRLVVDVPEGPHRIEIRKEGFDTYSTEITTARGETVPINVSLRSR